MHCCTTVSSHTVVIASGNALSPSQTAMQTSCTPRFFSSVSTCSQNFAPSPPSPAHRPEDVAFPADGDPNDHVDGFVADLPVADLHHVRSDRSAVPIFRSVRFCGPPPEPDVRLSPHPALPGSLGGGCGPHAAVGHGEGMRVPR